MRAVGPTIDAGEPTHSTTAHPKHSRALSASPAVPCHLCGSIRTWSNWSNWPNRRVRSRCRCKLPPQPCARQKGILPSPDEGKGVAMGQVLGPLGSGRGRWQVTRPSPNLSPNLSRNLARTWHATWHAPGTHPGTHLARNLARTWHVLVARHWQVRRSLPLLSGGRAAVRARIHRGRARRAGAFFRTRLSEFLLSRGHRLGHAAPSGRRIRWMGAGHERLRPSGEQSGDTWVARTCSRLRARSHW